MRTSIDALRSLSRYVSLALGSEWEVRFEDEEAAFERPFCRIQSATPVSLRSRGTIAAEYLQTFSIVAYPAEKPTPVAARLEGERVVNALAYAFTTGLVTSAYGRKQYAGIVGKTFQRGHGWRVPLYDFTGISLEQDVTETNRDPRDFLRVVEDPAFQTLEGTTREDEPETAYVVTGTVRVSWTRGVGIVTNGVIAEEVPVVGEASLPPRIVGGVQITPGGD